jgi:Ion channel
MPTALTVLLTLAGVGLTVGAVRDIFDALFHQGARGALSRSLMRGTWWVFHRLSRLRGGLLPVAGPIMLVVIVATWATLLALGWALIFWPHMPEGFLFSSTPGDRASAQFLDALYISLVTLGTIGFGDITPLEGWLRLVAPLEALLGFGLLTGSISWLLSIYPTLLRRRSLAYEIALLRKAEEERGLGVSGLRPEAAEGLYAELKSRLVAVERDLVTFPISYYFSSADERFALSRSMPYLLELAERGDDDANPPGVRLRAILLREAIDDFARSTAARFHGHPSDSTAELLHAYARDHMRESGDGAKRTSGGG